MKIVFIGTPQAAVSSLERLRLDGHEIVAVYTQPDRPSGRGNKITYSPVKQCAIENGFNVYQPEKIRTAEAIELFRSHKADAAAVVAYGRILPETFLSAFPCGAINLHFSLLPRYRGAAPVNWAIVNGEAETGVTTMQMDAGLDTGPILMQRAVAIGSKETAIELMDRLSVVGAQLLSETLSGLADLKPMPQDHSRATFAPILKRDDGLIDWSMTAAEIANRIRGFQPFPATFTHFAGARLTVWAASVVEDAGTTSPGEITEAWGDTLIVASGGDTALRISELQPEGKRRMAVRDFLNGSEIKVGDILGK